MVQKFQTESCKCRVNADCIKEVHLQAGENFRIKVKERQREIKWNYNMILFCFLFLKIHDMKFITKSYCQLNCCIKSWCNTCRQLLKNHKL